MHVSLRLHFFGGDDEDFTKDVVLFPRSVFLSFWKSLLEVEAEADSALYLQSNPSNVVSLESKVTLTPAFHTPSLSLSSLSTLNAERLVCGTHLMGVPEISEKGLLLSKPASLCQMV